MDLIFIYGTVASGKLTVGRALADKTGFALFHNHLIVDAVLAVFPFGSQSFVNLRERFWLDTFREAAVQKKSLIFTFAPEPSVAADFPQRVQKIIEGAGGRVHFVKLQLPQDEQERRLVDASRKRTGKMQSVDLLRELKPQFDACEERMPTPNLVIDTSMLKPDESADLISSKLNL
jgi:hypothetical protein